MSVPKSVIKMNKNGIKFETSDTWEFDAKAPTLDDNLIMENEKFSISFESETKPAAPQQAPRQNFDNQNNNQICFMDFRFYKRYLLTFL